MRPSGPSGSVIAAGVVAILVSLVTILIAVAAIAGMSLMPPASSSPPLPQSVKSTAVVMMVFLAGLAIFGIFTSVGVLHLRNWARVSMLIWGAVMAAFSGLALPFAAFMPMPEAPAQSPVALPFVRTLLLIVYGIPFLIGVWWRLLFNQRAITSSFSRRLWATANSPLRQARVVHCLWPFSRASPFYPPGSACSCPSRIFPST